MAARPLPKNDTTPAITIRPDSSWSGSVSINSGDTVQFDVPTFKSGHNQCVVVFSIRWSNQGAGADPGGPIIIGSSS